MIEYTLIGIIIGICFMAIYQDVFRDTVVSALSTFNDRNRQQYNDLMDRYESLVDEVVALANKSKEV